MQLLKAITLTSAMLPAALAKIDPLPTSTDAESYLSDHPSLSTVATGTQATSLVSAIYSVEKSWRDEDMYTTMYSHMWSAAAKATNSPDVVASLAVTGWSYWDTTEQSWWKDNMPDVRGWPLGLFNVEVPSIDYSKLKKEEKTLQG
ncbi:hypothetical protein CGCF415_v015665 [Colletotrichum fructicola]|nr:hypothetical protein CGCF415_v015665 [Colletotrichum fructicola]KAF4921306.1 hypothetical protein CGCF245_v015613 [Colletotrichum fructicola]